MVKTNQIQNIAATHTVNVADIGNWSPTGIALDATTTPKLSDLQLIGTTPSAVLYPDGSINFATTNGNGYMYPNGELRMWRSNTSNTSGNLDINLPKATTDIDNRVIFGNAIRDDHDVIVTSTHVNESTDHIRFRSTNQAGTSFAVKIQWLVIGRWK